MEQLLNLLLLLVDHGLQVGYRFRKRVRRADRLRHGSDNLMNEHCLCWIGKLDAEDGSLSCRRFVAHHLKQPIHCIDARAARQGVGEDLVERAAPPSCSGSHTSAAARRATRRSAPSSSADKAAAN